LHIARSGYRDAVPLRFRKAIAILIWQEHDGAVRFGENPSANGTQVAPVHSVVFHGGIVVRADEQFLRGIAEASDPRRSERLPVTRPEGFAFRRGHAQASA